MNLVSDDAPHSINPYTTCTALSAGWIWHTPLFGRSGNGYVYSSDFISSEDAERELRDHLGSMADGVEARHIVMRVGHNRRLWVNNCVSLGLAGGFVEPLESTGIFLIEMGLEHLTQNFPDKQFQPVFQDRYNRIMTHFYKEVLDFLVLHYCITHRTDTPFWKANHQHPAIPETLQRRMQQWGTVLPQDGDALEFGLMSDFLSYAYTSILAGMGHLPDQPAPISAYRAAPSDKTVADIQAEARYLAETLPDHYEYLYQLRLYDALRVAFAQDH